VKRASEAFTALWQPIADDVARRRRNNLTSGLILCNVIFCVVVAVCWGLEVQENVEAWPYISFFIGEVILIVICRANVVYSRTVARGISESLGSQAIPPASALPVADDPPSGLSFPLQAIGTLNAMLVGFLTYYTGGPSNSPYAQALVAMLLIAEQTREVKDPGHEDRFGRMIRKSIGEFRWFFALTALFYVPLGILQWRYPVDVPTAPVEATIGITAVIFVVGSVTNYLSGSSRDRRIVVPLSTGPEEQ
jgi:hypothetical protein